jgi:hypothetical protein
VSNATIVDGNGTLPMKADVMSRFRTSAKVCSLVILLVIAALGPAKWAPRTELGWQFDHFIGYFGITLFFCFAWPRPLVVGAIIMAVAALLEGLQALTPDRSANLEGRALGRRRGAGDCSRCRTVRAGMEVAAQECC